MGFCDNERSLPARNLRKGDPGESAYDFWKKHQPEGADTSECAYLEFQKGKKGDPGAGVQAIGVRITQSWTALTPP